MTAPGGGAPAGAATPARTTGGGCLKGCLVGCGGLVALVAVLAVVAWVGWRRWGRPWLDRKAQAVAHFVPSGLLPGHGGAGGGATNHLTAALSPKLPATAGETGRADLPHDLWVPAATGPAAYDTQAGGMATAVVRVKGATVAGLVTAARRGMHRLGWRLTAAGADGKGQALHFARRGAAARVGLYPRAGTVEVWVSRRATAAGSPAGSGAGSGR